MKIWILTFNDLVKYGFGTTSVYVFTNKQDAIDKMKTDYKEKCKEYDVTPFGDSDYYAYIQDMFYWDIFEKTI